jgi:hypothetical protein
MLAKHNTSLFVDWIDYIEGDETKDALRYLIGYTAGLSDLICTPQMTGTKRDFQLWSDYGVLKGQPFAFLVTKKWLLFYFRSVAVKSNKYSFQVISETFGFAAGTPGGEWTVKLHNIDEVRRLIHILNVQ